LYTHSSGALHFSTGPYFNHVGTNSTGLVPLREWVHVVAMVKDQQHAYYINGAPAGVSGDNAILFPGSKSTFRIGNTHELERTFWGMIDDVRLYDRALTQEEIESIMEYHSLVAWNPQPANGGYVSIRSPVSLVWSAGETAVAHDVYLGTDANAVESAEIASPLYWGRQPHASFPLTELLKAGERYFWRIDEVEADGVTIHKGEVWSFTVSGYSIIDDFESYTDVPGQLIEETWIDGSINNTGSQVSRWILAPSTARRGLRSKQAMSLTYDNARSPHYSEIERMFVPEQDWLAGLADTLSLSVKGDAVSFGEIAPGMYAVSAAGADIWSNDDQCRYAFRRLDGDGSMSVKIHNLVQTDVWAKAGVMIRETLTPASRHASMFVTPDGRRAFQNRPDDGSGFCFTAHSHPGAIALPYWVKLERRGDQFTAYHSPDGVNWIKQPDDEDMVSYQTSNPATISMPKTVYIGFALSSHNQGLATTATFSDVKTTGYVGSQWQVAEIGYDHPGNSPDDLYVIVEDGDGRVAAAVNPDPMALNALTWTEWRIPFGSLSRVDFHRVKRLTIGGREGSASLGLGRILIDDIRVWKP